MEKKNVNICDVCDEIFAGGDAPKSKFSKKRTDDFPIPIYSNGEAENGLYGYTNFSRVNVPSITVSARGTIGYTAIRYEPFVPIVRLITLVPKTDVIDIKYLYYATQNYSFMDSGTSIPQLTVPMLKKYSFPLPNMEKQKHIANILDKLTDLIDKRKKQLEKLDELVKARFVEMFGDPIRNTKKKETKKLKDVLILRAGDFTVASDISKEPTEVNKYPCYGGNGIRGYVSDYNQEGNYSLIGRQGALSGNVQYVSGCFKNTEHALLVTPIIEMDSIWLNQLLSNLDLKRYQTGAAQPGLSVKNLQEVQIISVPIDEQHKYSKFIKLVIKSKSEVQKGLEKLELLKNALMQEYFG